jgi:hypothetical protein
VKFASECLDPLMQEMEEVNMVLHLLYASKINYLEELQRIPACQDDNDGSDILFTSSISNQWGLVTPYKVSFRGFSTEVASVLMNFANSSNCFVVKYLNVRPSSAPLPVVTDEAGNQQQLQPQYIQPEYAPQMEDEDGGDRRMRRRRRPPQQMQAAPQPVQPTGPAPPETILRELPLYVTIVVDVVKLTAPAPEPTNAPAAPRAGRTRAR